MLIFMGVSGHCEMSGVMFTGWGRFEDLGYLCKGVGVFSRVGIFSLVDQFCDVIVFTILAQSQKV